MRSKRVVMCILALLTCTLSGCNTKIGWPWDYWQSGFFAVVGLLVVCGLIFMGLMLIIVAATEVDRGMLAGGVALPLVAALLLQALPNTASGIQFMPLFPWQHDAWLARIISGACWLALVLGCQQRLAPRKKIGKGLPSQLSSDSA